MAHEENWKGRGYEGYVVAASINIADQGYIAAVVVNKDSNSNRFYLYKVFLKEKLQGEAFKTGASSTKYGALIGASPHGAIFSLLQDVYLGKGGDAGG